MWSMPISIATSDNRVSLPGNIANLVQSISISNPIKSASTLLVIHCIDIIADITVTLMAPVPPIIFSNFLFRSWDQPGPHGGA